MKTTDEIQIQLSDIPFDLIATSQRSLLFALATAFEDSIARVATGLLHMMENTIHDKSQKEVLRKCLQNALCIGPLLLTKVKDEVKPLSGELSKGLTLEVLPNGICDVLRNPRTGFLEILCLMMVWVKVCQKLAQASDVVLIRNTATAWERCSVIIDSLLTTESLNMRDSIVSAIQSAESHFRDVLVPK